MPQPVQQPRQVVELLKVLHDLRDCAERAQLTSDPEEKLRQEGKQNAYEAVLSLIAPRQQAAPE